MGVQKLICKFRNIKENVYTPCCSCISPKAFKQAAFLSGPFGYGLQLTGKQNKMTSPMASYDAIDAKQLTTNDSITYHKNANIFCPKSVEPSLPPFDD